MFKQFKVLYALNIANNQTLVKNLYKFLSSQPYSHHK